MIKPNTVFFLITASTLAVTHYLAIEFYLYWLYLWFDMPMHFLGGVTVALGYLSVRDFIVSLPLWLFKFVPTIFFVLLVAVSWEVFEFWTGLTTDEALYVNDTLSDLVLGVLGGTLGYLVGKRIGYFNYD